MPAPDAPPPVLMDYATEPPKPPSRRGAVGALACSGLGLLVVGVTHVGTEIHPVEAVFGIAVAIGFVGAFLGFRAKRRAARKPGLYGGRPAAVCAIVAGALCPLAAILWLTVILPAEREAENRRVCANNLLFAGDQLACCQAEKPPHLFPASVIGLARGLGYVPENGQWPKFLHCPSDQQKRACSYYYVPGYGPDAPYAQIIMYDDPANHGGAGGCVLRGDGNGVWLPSPQFEAAINSIKLPDGTPYAPHKSSSTSQPTSQNRER